MLRRLVPVALLAALLAPATYAAPAGAAGLPSKATWLKDTDTALSGSRTYVKDRVAAGGSRLALNFDIDNSALQSYYDHGKAIPASLKLAAYAKTQGVKVFFNTGRNVASHDATLVELRKAGLPVDGLCMRNKGETLTHSKQRCRDVYRAKGYTLVANIGNRSTDFTGTGYERAYKLPNYGGKLA